MVLKYCSCSRNSNFIFFISSFTLFKLAFNSFNDLFPVFAGKLSVESSFLMASKNQAIFLFVRFRKFINSATSINKNQCNKSH